MNNSYEEYFEKSFVEKDKINYVIEEVKKQYPSSSGWFVSEPVITENPDGKTVKMVFKLSKTLDQSSTRSR